MLAVYKTLFMKINAFEVPAIVLHYLLNSTPTGFQVHLWKRSQSVLLLAYVDFASELWRFNWLGGSNSFEQRSKKEKTKQKMNRNLVF